MDEHLYEESSGRTEAATPVSDRVAWEIISFWIALALIGVGVVVGLTVSSITTSHSRATCSRYHAPSDCKALFP